MTNSASPLQHAENIIRQYHLIAEASEITISEENMLRFNEFLALLSNEHGTDFADEVLANPQIQEIKPGIQRLFSQGSSMYERHWANQIVQSATPQQVFTQHYPYYQHYQRATALEIHAIQSLAAQPVKRVLMVGSGALPVTSMALNKAGFATSNLDIHEADLALGQAVSDKLDANHGMRFIHNDICNETDLGEYDVVWLAALVGDEEIKAKIIKHLYERMQPGSQLIVRTAYNLRALLYPAANEQDLLPFEVKLKIQTYADNFHSMLIAQKPV